MVLLVTDSIFVWIQAFCIYRSINNETQYFETGSVYQLVLLYSQGYYHWSYLCCKLHQSYTIHNLILTRSILSRLSLSLTNSLLLCLCRKSYPLNAQCQLGRQYRQGFGITPVVLLLFELSLSRSFIYCLFLLVHTVTGFVHYTISERITTI